ncbi:MAG: thiolase family protein [bacterium]|nr:thiolase family protein [bacterium]
MPVSGEVAIVGAGVTPFGVLHELSYLDLIARSANAAVSDAGINMDLVEAAWLGTAEPLTAGLVGDSGAAVAQAIDFSPRPVTRVSNFCTSGMEAVRAGAMAIAAGEHDVVLAIGAEKMRDVTPRGSLVAKTAEQTHPTLAKGRTAPGQFALLANRYLHTYGASKEDLALVAVKNHGNANRNPKAHFHHDLTVDDVLSAPRVAEPLGLYDCTPTTDGGASVVMASREWAEANARRFALIEGMGLAVTGGYYSNFFDGESDYLGFESTRAAAAKAYEQAGITNPRQELDVLECHDCFTITEIVNTEDLGIAAPGKGVELLKSGATSFGGDIPVNLSGGLQACGHPVGATGVRMIAEIFNQVTGEAGERQVQGARRGLAHTLGGPGVIASVIVLGSPGD